MSDDADRPAPDPVPTLRPGRRALLAGLAATAVAGCSPPIFRQAAAETDLLDAAPYGIRDVLVREWGDSLSPEASAAVMASWTRLLRATRAEQIAAGGPLTETVLILSGGGPDGAFGAGLLNGWTERGDRPEFTIVTGISTGAILALFAFLGPEWDEAMTQIYTTYRTAQLFTPTIFAALTGGPAATDATPYRALIDSYVTDEVVARIAAEQAKGRALLIGTTNLDAVRPVIWNVSAIATSGHPEAPRLIRDVIQASSAIPGAFPPVLIPVHLPDGRVRDELHVDGGATQQLMFFTPDFPMRRVDRELGVRIDRTAWVVVNNKLQKPYAAVPPRLLRIAAAAAGGLLGGSGSGDLYRLWAIAARDEIDLNIVSIPRAFDAVATEAFDPIYMRALFDLGREMGLAGDAWSKVPPDFVLD